MFPENGWDIKSIVTVSSGRTKPNLYNTYHRKCSNRIGLEHTTPAIGYRSSADFSIENDITNWLNDTDLRLTATVNVALHNVSLSSDYKEVCSLNNLTCGARKLFPNYHVQICKWLKHRGIDAEQSEEGVCGLGLFDVKLV